MTFRQYLRLSRPPTLAATASPWLVGTAAAWHLGRASWPLALGMGAVALLLQVATNLLNEADDYRRGVDHPGLTGIAGVIVQGELSEAEVRGAARLTLGLALAGGLLLSAVRGPLLLAIGLLGIAVIYGYNSGPRPISATPWGELLVAVVMGPLEVVAAEVAAAGQISGPALWASASVALLVAAILLSNNLRDAASDHARGRRTLAILLGPRRGRLLLSATGAAAVALPLLWIVLGRLPAGCAVVLAALPALWPVVRSRPGPVPLPAVARLHLVVGLLLAIGLALG